VLPSFCVSVQRFAGELLQIYTQHIFAHLIELSKGLSSTAENSVASPVVFFSARSLSLYKRKELEKANELRKVCVPCGRAVGK